VKAFKILSANSLITSAEEVMYWQRTVCVYVRVQNISNRYEQILMKPFGGLGVAQGPND